MTEENDSKTLRIIRQEVSHRETVCLEKSSRPTARLITLTSFWVFKVMSLQYILVVLHQPILFYYPVSLQSKLHSLWKKVKGIIQQENKWIQNKKVCPPFHLKKTDIGSHGRVVKIKFCLLAPLAQILDDHSRRCRCFRCFCGTGRFERCGFFQWLCCLISSCLVAIAIGIKHVQRHHSMRCLVAIGIKRARRRWSLRKNTRTWSWTESGNRSCKNEQESNSGGSHVDGNGWCRVWNGDECEKQCDESKASTKEEKLPPPANWNQIQNFNLSRTIQRSCFRMTYRRFMMLWPLTKQSGMVAPHEMVGELVDTRWRKDMYYYVSCGNKISDCGQPSLCGVSLHNDKIRAAKKALMTSQSHGVSWWSKNFFRVTL